MNLNEIINKINGAALTSSHKATLDIFNLLNNHKEMFLKTNSSEEIIPLISAFEKLSLANLKEYHSYSYKSEFEATLGTLKYHLDKII